MILLLLLLTILIRYRFELQLNVNMAQSAGAAEYTDCISADEQDSPNECPGYDTTQSDGEASVILELWGMQRTPSLLSRQVDSGLSQ